MNFTDRSRDQTHNPKLRDSIVVGVNDGGHGSGVHLHNRIPKLESAYAVAPRLRSDTALWLADPDLFVDGTEGLALDPRTIRCIGEALASYRKGNYLAAASLLGASSEGAWYAAGERLRSIHSKLDKPLENDRTAVVIKQVAEALRQIKGPSEEVEPLEAHADLMRQLRNYGVHPRSTDDGDLESHFTDTGAGLLLLHAHKYLRQLSSLVELRLAQTNP